MCCCLPGEVAFFWQPGVEGAEKITQDPGKEIQSLPHLLCLQGGSSLSWKITMILKLKLACGLSRGYLHSVLWAWASVHVPSKTSSLLIGQRKRKSKCFLFK